MDLNVISYLTYLVISIGITVWVAKTLFKNGKVFLEDIFDENSEFANSVNKLLLAGFYLINIGYVVFNLKIYNTIEDTRELVERLSYKVGAIILILGFMHFFNLFVLFRLRNRAKKQRVGIKVAQSTVV